jgi:sugar lactone lactonase YvrE
VDTPQELLAGEGNGVAVTSDGRLVSARGWESAALLPEAVLIAGDVAPDGSIYVGTGFPAKLYRVDSDGGAQELAEVPSEQVTAVHATREAVLVGTAAPAAVHRWVGDELVEIARMDAEAASGVWDLAMFDAEVVAAVGSPAVLYRVHDKGLRRWVELPDSHARCLATVDDQLIVGTSGKGMVFRVASDGTRSLLVDSPFTEISAMTRGPGDDVWAAAVVGKPEKTNGADDDGASTLSDLKLPKVGKTTASSELLRLTPEGATISVHRFPKQVAMAVDRAEDGVVVGTGFAGEVWRFVPEGGARLAVLDAIQITRIIGGGEVLLAQGPSQVFLRSASPEEGVRYTSPVKTLERPAHWGRYELMPSAEGRIRFRHGATEPPDATWSEWSEWLPAETGQVPLGPAPNLQWELELTDAAAASGVDRIQLAYREVNLPPVVESVEVDEPGVVYLSGPPPSDRIVEVSNPDINGIFTVLGERDSASDRKGKRYWRVGFRTVAWEVKDPNGDALRFDLHLERRDGGPEVTVRTALEQTQLGVDMTAVPDGWYRFVLVASDAPTNAADPAVVRATSPWFVVDSSPPEVSLELAADGERWRVRARDRLSPLTRAQWSRDGDGWSELEPLDGLLDEPDEEFELERAEGSHLLVVRVVDRQHNRATAGTVED